MQRQDKEETRALSAEVMTVLGPVPADQLGITLPHEHLLIDMHRVTRIGDHLLNDVPLAIKEVSAFRQAGGSSLVDVTNRNLGRDPAALQRIARETGLNIMAPLTAVDDSSGGPSLRRQPASGAPAVIRVGAKLSAEARCHRVARSSSA